MPAELSDDPYAILGVPRTATPAEIKEQYRRLAKATHPDIDGRPEAMARMVRINHAYELLADPLRRARWDALNPVQRPGQSRPGSSRGSGGAAPSGGRTGPSVRPQGRSTPPPASPPPPSGQPTLDEAFAFRLGFGKYQGKTLREVVIWDRGYVEWVARTNGDRPRLQAAARRVLMHLDQVEREAREAEREATDPVMGVHAAPSRTAPPRPVSRIDRVAEALAHDRRLLFLIATLAALASFVVLWLIVVLWSP